MPYPRDREGLAWRGWGASCRRESRSRLGKDKIDQTRPVQDLKGKKDSISMHV